MNQIEKTLKTDNFNEIKDLCKKRLGLSEITIEYFRLCSDPKFTEEEVSKHLGVSSGNMRYQAGTGLKTYLNMHYMALHPQKEAEKLFYLN